MRCVRRSILRPASKSPTGVASAKRTTRKVRGSASASASLMLPQAQRNCAAISPTCSGEPSAALEVWPERKWTRLVYRIGLLLAYTGSLNAPGASATLRPTLTWTASSTPWSGRGSGRTGETKVAPALAASSA